MAQGNYFWRKYCPERWRKNSDGERRCENETHLAGRVTKWAKATNSMNAWASVGAHMARSHRRHLTGRPTMTPKKVILAHAELSFGPSVPATHTPSSLFNGHSPAFAAPVAQSNDKKLIGAPSIRRLLTLSECRGAPFAGSARSRTDAKSQRAAPATWVPPRPEP